MSHVQNLQSFDKVIRICTGLGGSYNPGQQNLQVYAMSAKLNIAQQIWEEVKAAQQAYDNATNARELGFRHIRKLSSNVYGLLKACGANPLLLKDALNSKRRIWGARISKPPVETPDTPEAEKQDERPSYSRAYSVTAEYFDRLVKTVASESRYQPNEPHLSLPGLHATLLELFALNKAVQEAETRLDEARSKRNNVYYVAPDNLVSTALAVKTYVRSVFGFQSQEHQLMQKIRFTKPEV
ncbi:MAG: hypothetical protein JNJ65_05255 [Cyclobacteriaceae bacterium]|nr:hypothetical protein [Cyclobacteriaceae bacterium]